MNRTILTIGKYGIISPSEFDNLDVYLNIAKNIVGKRFYSKNHESNCSIEF